ncbi:MAG: PfkB family carbohydrate kinase [Patescibacteria group bacterium]
MVVLGSIGIDTIETPYGKVVGGLGGSAVYAALAALSVSRRAAKVALTSVVGDDFPDKHRKFLQSQGIALDGLVTVDTPTFRWHGRYQFDMGVAETVKTDLGSLAYGKEVITGYQMLLDSPTPGVDKGVTSGYKPSFLLLANFDPEVQLQIIQASPQPLAPFVILDTMNFWIKNKNEALRAAIQHVDALVLNENEAREFFGTPNLVKAGHGALELGPEYVIIKKGEHGSMLFSEHGFFAVPGYPLLSPVDPTGAGDSFAGSLAGVLAREGFHGTGLKFKGVTFNHMRKAVVYATAVSSFTVEGMGVSRLAALKPVEIKERVEVFQKMRQF